MKSIKYLVWSLILVAGGVFTACTEDNTYKPAEKEGNTVYFAAGTATVSVADQTSADISVLRSDDSEALTVALTVSADDVLTVPTSVSFAAGSKEAKLTVSFDPEELEFDESYTAELTIADPESTSLYGASTITVTVTRPAPWISLGTGLFYDSFVFYVPYYVEFQQNQLYPTNFRLVAPYTEGLQNEEEGYDYDGSESPYLNFYLMKPGSKLNDTTITTEGLVYFDRTSTFYHPTYSDNVWIYHPSVFTNFQTEASWSYNTVISWQDDAHTLPAEIELAPYYYIPAAGGGWNYTTDPTIYMVFPGVVVADYSVEIELSGYFKDLSENNFAVVNVTLGEDVEEVKLASASGNDVEAIYNAIVAGTVETVSVTADGSANLPVVDGKNTVVAVSYANGEPQEYDYITFNFFAGEDTRTPLEKEWTAADIYPLESKDELFKTWNLWAVDMYDEDGNTDRQFIYKWTFSEGETIEIEDEDYGSYTIETVNLDGFSLGLAEDDTTPWEFYEGFIYSLAVESMDYIDGYYIDYSLYDVAADDYYSTKNESALIGGLVDDGYMAIVNSGLYSDYGVQMDGYCIEVYREEDDKYMGDMATIYDIMLQDPALASNAESYAVSAVKTHNISTLHNLAKTMATPKNFVELRGRERVHALIDELNANKKQTSVEPQIEVIARKGSRFSKDMTVQASPVMLK